MLCGADSLSAWRVAVEAHLCPAAHGEDLLQTVLPVPHRVGAPSGRGFGDHHSSGHWKGHSWMLRAPSSLDLLAIRQRVAGSLK